MYHVNHFQVSSSVALSRFTTLHITTTIHLQTMSSSQTETLSPLNTNSPSPLLTSLLPDTSYLPTYFLTMNVTIQIGHLENPRGWPWLSKTASLGKWVQISGGIRITWRAYKSTDHPAPALQFPIQCVRRRAPEFASNMLPGDPKDPLVPGAHS